MDKETKFAIKFFLIFFVLYICAVEYSGHKTHTINWRVYNCNISYADGHSESVDLYGLEGEDPPKISSTIFGGSLYIENLHTEGLPRYIYGVTELKIVNVRIEKEVKVGNACKKNGYDI